MKYRLFIIWLSLKWIFRVNLGDHVWYSGKKYIVSNGVCPESWRLIGLNNGNNGWVKRCECRKSWTPWNIWHSFKSGYLFYMGYWYDIWKREGIQDWMKKCNIW